MSEKKFRINLVVQMIAGVVLVAAIMFPDVTAEWSGFEKRIFMVLLLIALKD